MEGKRLDKWLYVLSVVIYGTNGYLLRSIALPSEMVVLCRCVIGTLFVLLLQRARGQRIDWKALRAQSGCRVFRWA